MPETQNENRPTRDLISQFVIAHDDPPGLARLKGFEFLAEARKVDQPVGDAGELLHHPRCSLASDWLKMFVKTHKIRRYLARPFGFS